MIDSEHRHRPSEVAIVGMSVRAPGAASLDEFWRNIRDGVESISFFTDGELVESGIDPATLRDSRYVKAAGVIDGPDLFDAPLFGMNPREAAMTDPQQRLFLECAWEALEHAGCDPQRFEGSIGVFAGARTNSYLPAVIGGIGSLGPVETLQANLGNEADFLATRVSYKLNLHGPAITVQTACSTSLVAVHLACQSLLCGECDAAIAGGAAVNTPQRIGYFYEEGGIVSPDGRCRAFDAAARGTVFGNGLGVVVLKRLVDALAQGDTIHAVIRGSAVNNDGAGKVGFTAPSVDGQARVIAEAIAIAEVDPGSITYVETHGTGTALGDPIEIAALTRAFGGAHERRRFCAIGSVKTNIGHLDTAAGVAGLIKTALALEHGLIPPSLHFTRPNPEIDFERSPFFVNTALRRWETSPRRAGVSSFGLGGTNAHVVLEEAPAFARPTAGEPQRSPHERHLLLLSASSGTALAQSAERLAAHLETDRDIDMRDVVHTLQVGRREMKHRRVLACRDAADAVHVLRGSEPGRSFDAVATGEHREAVFLFPGQGAQYVNMGRGLYATEPEFRGHVDRCSRLLETELRFDLRSVLYPAAGSEADASRRLAETAVTQPALFTVEYALAQFLMSLGIRPAAMIGHSVGEYVAASLAGVFPLEDALRLVAARGRLMQGMPRGAMLAAALDEATLGSLLPDGLSIAAVNGPGSCVASGPAELIEELARTLDGRGIDHTRLRTSHAYHSPMMDPVVARFRDRLRRIDARAPAIPFLSNATGAWISPEEATDPFYWSMQLRNPVRFSDCLAELAKRPDRALIEVGPSRTLITLMRRHPARNAAQILLQTLPHPDDDQSDAALFAESLGRLWLTGFTIDWERCRGGERGRRIPLPTYPFERKRYWFERAEPTAGGPVAAAERPGGAPGAPATDAERRRGAPGAPLVTAKGIREPTGAPSPLDGWLYAPVWTRADVVWINAELPRNRRSCWLIFADECGFGERLAGRLVRDGRRVVTVHAGRRFEKIDEGRYRIGERSREDYDALVRLLVERGERPERIVHAWGVTAADRATPGRRGRPGARSLRHESPEEGLSRGFYSLLFLAQGLGPYAASSPIDVTVLTTHAAGVTGEERVEAEKAAVLGPCMVIPIEYESVSCRSIDIALPPAGSRLETRLIELLLRECAGGERTAIDRSGTADRGETERGRDREVAYRGTERWVRSFMPVRIPRAGTADVVREGGIYLITGGLGGIGLALAELVADTPGTKLALVGRSGLPPRKRWDAWLGSHGETDETARRIRAVRTLEEKGAEVLVAVADVSDEPAMRRAVRLIRRRFGRINGAIHAAGVAGGGVIALKTEEDAARVLAPKVHGTLVLERVLERETLDFLVLCSSLNALVPAFGQADYCAANRFLDAFAHSRKVRTGAFTVSVDWDRWAGVGMAAAADAVEWSDRLARAEAAASPGGRPVHGLPLIDRCLERSETRATFATSLDPARHWILDEHRLSGNAVVPGTAYLEIAREAAAEIGGSGACEMSGITFVKPLVVPDERPVEVYTVLTRGADHWDFVVGTKHGAPGTVPGEHAVGRIRWIPAAAGSVDIEGIERRLRAEARNTGRDGPETRGADRADAGRGGGFGETIGSSAVAGYGPRWNNVRSVIRGEDELLARLELSGEFSDDLDRFILHPALLDTATGISSVLLDGGYLPCWYRRITARGSIPRAVYSHVRRAGERGGAGDTASFDITVTDDAGAELVRIEEFTMRRIGERDVFTHEPHAARDAAISPEEGREILTRVLAGNVWPQVIVSTSEPGARLERARRLTGERIAGAESSSEAARPASSGLGGPRARHERPGITAPYVAPRTESERIIAGVWQELLGIDGIGIRDNFFELGGDSVMGLRIVALANRHGIRISPPMLFRHQSVEELARAVDAGSDGAAVGADGSEGGASIERAAKDRHVSGVAAPRGEAADGRLKREEFPDSELSQRELDRLAKKLSSRKKDGTR